MWYVIQTTTGSEETLVCLIKEMISEEFYKECFYIKRECARKEGDRWHIHLGTMFPGYLFVDTDKPKEMYMELKKEEQRFLEEIQDRQHVVRRSLVQLDADRKIISADGPVGRYLSHIVRQRIRKRYVLIERELLGEKRNILFGIRLDEDKLADD